MAKVYVSLFIFLFTCLAFPRLYNEAQAINTTDPGLNAGIKAFPIILIVIVAIIPAYLYLEGKSNE